MEAVDHVFSPSPSTLLCTGELSHSFSHRGHRNKEKASQIHDLRCFGAAGVGLARPGSPKSHTTRVRRWQLPNSRAVPKRISSRAASMFRATTSH